MTTTTPPPRKLLDVVREMKLNLSQIKPYLRWLIFGATLWFVFKTFKERWQQVTEIRIDGRSWFILFLALGVTLLAHLWSAWVWTWLLKMFQQTIGEGRALQIYLMTNIAKYLPGNVGHLYARITAVSQAGSSLSMASLSVLLEPILMAESALLLAIIGNSIGWIETASQSWYWSLQIVVCLIILTFIHPRSLNFFVRSLAHIKGNIKKTESIYIRQYPLLPLLGEIGFLLLRGMGFLIVWLALAPVELKQIPTLFSAFNFAWLMGLIVPGAPGGMGVFEATAIALLVRQPFPSGILLTAIALYRLISILAEAIAAGIATLFYQKEQLSKP